MKVPLKVIIKQLKKDLIGKDSHRGVTLTYSWMANQFGHFSLGFIPTYLLYLFLQNWFPIDSSAIYATVTVALHWTFFEAYNFIWPLIKLQRVNAFKSDYKNIGYDTFTDLCFFYYGGIIAFLTFSTINNIWLYTAILVAILIWSSRYWYLTKLCIQSAKFPFQSRLCMFTLPIDENSKKEILNFMSDMKHNNLLIFGGHLTGKSTLAVSIATELAIKRISCYYTTFSKLLQMTNKSDEGILQHTKNINTWRTSSCLVIDDINIGNGNCEIASPKNFLTCLTNTDYKNQNITAIRNQKNIWVVGDYKNSDKWVNSLLKIGFNKNEILSVYL